MRRLFVIDTYAWVEYFMGSPLGERSGEYIEGDAVTPTMVVLELRRLLLKRIGQNRETSQGAEEKMDYVRSTSTILDLSYESSISAAGIDLEMKKRVSGWGAADSIVLEAARRLGGKVVTGDEHFRGLPETIMIK
jgi:predicted nucleic acid-binding protein